MIEKYIEQFEMKTKKSKELWLEAKKYLPGGVSGSAAFLSPNPVYIESAVGARIVDIDGNEYIDMLLGGFPNILGHSAPPVVDAVNKQIKRGTVPILFNKTGVELAKKITQHMPHIELLRFTNTGSEATMFALRAARSFTKKSKLAKMEGGYD